MYVILGRHGETVENKARREGSPDARLQTADTPLTPFGHIQGFALGLAVAEFALAHRVSIQRMESSPALRAQYTRNNVRNAFGSLGLHDVHMPSPNKRLREHDKGSLQGALRSEAYPDPETKHLRDTRWSFAHGGDGETPYQTGQRFLQWLHRANNLHRDSSGSGDPSGQSAIIAIGHRGIFKYGSYLLTHPNKTLSQLPPLNELPEDYLLDNGEALILGQDQDRGNWTLVGRITPSNDELVEAAATLLGQDESRLI